MEIKQKLNKIADLLDNTDCTEYNESHDCYGCCGCCRRFLDFNEEMAQKIRDIVKELK